MIKPMVLAIDPGGTTGIAMRGSTGEIMTTTTDTPEELWDHVTKFDWTTVVCERFAAVTISRHGLYTVRLVGGVEALCRVKQIPFVLRTTQQRLAYLAQANSYLKSLKQPYVDHQADALAHLYSWEAQQTCT